MTLEERFEQWKSEQYKDQSTEEKFEFVEHLHYFPKHFKKTYLAGATENGIVWHDLRKDTEDYPKENKLYLVSIKDNGLAIAYFNGLHWQTKYNMGDFGHLVEEVIAWCEIPTFDKE